MHAGVGVGEIKLVGFEEGGGRVLDVMRGDLFSFC